MKIKEAKNIIKTLVREVYTIMQEDHESGEWWIDETGGLKEADGNMTAEDKNEAMRQFGWKRMKSSGRNDDIEIETWKLKAEDIRKIVKGVENIITFNGSLNDKDKEIGNDKYAGPRLRIYVKSNQKIYKGVPYGLLKKALPSNLRNYDTNPEPLYENTNYIHRHKEYRMYEGYNTIYVIFEDNSKLKFEVHYRNKHGPDREKWRRQAKSKWKSLANEIHRNVELNKACNPIQKSWKQSFEEALKHPELKKFIRHPNEIKIWPEEVTVDPVNFTPRI